MFENYESAVGIPVSLFWKELIIAFPDAKFILTVRDKDSWYQSVKKTHAQTHQSWIQTIWQLFDNGHRTTMETLDKRMWNLFGGIQNFNQNRKTAKTMYEARNQV